MPNSKSSKCYVNVKGSRIEGSYKKVESPASERKESYLILNREGFSNFKITVTSTDPHKNHTQKDCEKFAEAFFNAKGALPNEAYSGWNIRASDIHGKDIKKLAGKIHSEFLGQYRQANAQSPGEPAQASDPQGGWATMEVGNTSRYSIGDATLVPSAFSSATPSSDTLLSTSVGGTSPAAASNTSYNASESGFLPLTSVVAQGSDPNVYSVQEVEEVEEIDYLGGENVYSRDYYYGNFDAGQENRPWRPLGR